MTNRYEVLLLAVPQITGEEAASLEKELERILKDAQGKVISFERWGKYKLAYPVKNNEYGVYFLSRFEIEGNKAASVGAVNTLYSVKFNDIVMRNMISQLPEHAPLAYNRPESLEEAPSREGSFMKEGRGGRASMSSLHDNDLNDSRHSDLADFNSQSN